MTSPVRLEILTAKPLAVVRRQVSAAELSRVVPEGCGLVWNALRAHSVRGGRNVAVYLDDAIRLEVAVELLGLFSGSGEVVTSATPPGRVASLTHFGPYATLNTAHDAIHAWCSAAGHRMTRVRWEVYGHWRHEWTRDPSAIRIDVQYLLADA